MKTFAPRVWLVLSSVLAVAVVTAGCAQLQQASTSAGQSEKSVLVPAPSPELSAPVLESPALNQDSSAPNPETTAPAFESPAAAPAESAVVVLAGGCFWGVQGVFEHVKGVTRAESGYAGGSAETANYDDVSGGSTGHAEAVAITYDPAQVTLGQILQIFFSVVHDPTQLNRQGPDSGTQYRSAIFPQNADQQQFAQAYIAQLDKDKVFEVPIVTTVEIGSEFFPAEAHHQDFLNSNPDYPYIVINDLPKVEALERVFPELYSAEPVLILDPQ